MTVVSYKGTLVRVFALLVVTASIGLRRWRELTDADPLSLTLPGPGDAVSSLEAETVLSRTNVPGVRAGTPSAGSPTGEIGLAGL